jgi:hypothetical protein
MHGEMKSKVLCLIGSRGCGRRWWPPYSLAIAKTKQPEPSEPYLMALVYVVFRSKGLHVVD